MITLLADLNILLQIGVPNLMQKLAMKLLIPPTQHLLRIVKIIIYMQLLMDFLLRLQLIMNMSLLVDILR